MTTLWRRKSIEDLQREQPAGQGFERTLGIWQLTGIGLGGIIGVGIFVLTGVVAATQAGPGVALSFVIAGVASAAAALAYAEFAGMIPVAGSAYTYGYVVLGEFLAWIIGWDLLLEYGLAVATVAIGWAGYLQALLEQGGLGLPEWAQGAPGTGPGRLVDVTAVLASLAITGLLMLRTEWGVRFNTVLVIVKLAAVVLVIAAGVAYIDPANWNPFLPFGAQGVISGAALVFFAVFGYEALTTAAEEARDPQRDLPRAVILSLAISLTLYILMALVLTGIVRYDRLNSAAPVADAFNIIGLGWVTTTVSIAALAGITSVMLAFLLGCSRIMFSMSRDGLLPRWFARVHPRWRTPYRPTAVIGLLVALLAGLLPIEEVAELVNIGTLSAFIVVCAAVIILRRRSPEIRRSFRCPWVPVVPLLGIGFSAWLIISLPPVTWLRFAIWLAIGVAIYFAYGARNSALNQTPAPASR